MGNEPSEVRSVEVIGKVLGVAAAFLPAVGVGARWVAFDASGQVSTPFRLALSASVSDLIATGFIALLFPAGAFVVAVVSLHRAIEESEGSADVLERSVAYNMWMWLAAGPRRQPIAWTVGILLTIVVLGFIPTWPGSHLIALGTGLAGVVLVREANKRGRLSLARLWPVSVLIVAIAVVWLGLAGSVGTSIAQFRFTDGTANAPPTGLYIELGEAGDSLYLLSCSERSTLRIPKTTVAMVVFVGRKNAERPSLFEVIFRGKTVHLGMPDYCALASSEAGG